MGAIDTEDLFTMSNLSPRRTGRPFVVWVSPKGGAPHDVRVKVSRGPKAIPGEFIEAVREGLDSPLPCTFVIYERRSTPCRCDRP